MMYQPLTLSHGKLTSDQMLPNQILQDYINLWIVSAASLSDVDLQMSYFQSVFLLGTTVQAELHSELICWFALNGFLAPSESI